MLSFRKWSGLAVAIGLGAACGGSSFTNAGTTGEGGAEDGAGAVGSSGGDATSSGGSSGSSGAAGEGGTSGGQDGPSDGLASGEVTDASQRIDGGADAPVMNCPDVRGTYAVAILQGAGGGCSDLNATAPQCIRQGTQGLCGIELHSNPSGGVQPAVNGTGLLQPNGSLNNASLTLGSQDRSGCTATWSAAASTLTVDCGGLDSSQSCVVALTRTSLLATNCN